MPSLQRIPIHHGENIETGAFYQQKIANYEKSNETPNSFEFSVGSTGPSLGTGLSLSDRIYHQYLLPQHLNQHRQQVMPAAEIHYLHSTIPPYDYTHRQYQVDPELHSSIIPRYQYFEDDPSNISVAKKRPTEVIVIDDSENDNDDFPEGSHFNPQEEKGETLNLGPIHTTVESNMPKVSSKNHSATKLAAIESSIVIPTDISEIVSLAASMVADEIRSGIYSASDQSASVLEGTAASLEMFAKDVILPSLLAANNACIDFDEDSDRNKNSTVPTSLDTKSNRILIASLMNLREVMAMNAKSVFALEDNVPGYGKMSETWTIQALGIATSVVVAVTQNLNVNSISKLLFDTIEGYDNSKEEFVSCLERADARTLGATPKRLLNRAENIAFRVSFNTARAVHPLVTRGNENIGLLPAGTTAFISMVEVGTDGTREYSQERKKKKLK
jgi:hypothetical protein